MKYTILPKLLQLQSLFIVITLSQTNAWIIIFFAAINKYRSFQLLLTGLDVMIIPNILSLYLSCITLFILYHMNYSGTLYLSYSGTLILCNTFPSLILNLLFFNVTVNLSHKLHLINLFTNTSNTLKLILPYKLHLIKFFTNTSNM